MKYCTKCGSAITDDAMFCGKCGTPVNPQASQNNNTQKIPPQRPQSNQQRPQNNPQMRQGPYGSGVNPVTPPPNNKKSNKTPIIVLSIILGVVVVICTVVLIAFAVSSSREEQTTTPEPVTQADYDPDDYEEPITYEEEPEEDVDEDSNEDGYRVAPEESIGEDYFYSDFDNDEDRLCATVLAINEYFAREGCKFKTPQLQEYFDEQSWYENKGKTADESVLSGTAKKNVEKLYKDRDYYKKKLGVSGLASTYSYDDFVEIAESLN